MWIMTSFGVLSTVAIPAKVDVDPQWELQVRARDRTALVKLRKRYLKNASRIFATPNMDYEFRMYTTKADLAEAMDHMIGDINYENFKLTTDRRGGGGPDLHDLYVRIWGTVRNHYSPHPMRRDTNKNWWNDK